MRGERIDRGDPPPVLVIGNPGDRRTRLFEKAVWDAWGRPARLLPWSDVLADPVRLAEAVDETTIVRIDSPGDDFLVWRKLVAMGAQDRRTEVSTSIAEDEAQALSPELGRVRFLRQWYLGWCRALESIATTLAAHPPRSVMNPPDAIRLCFDKDAVHEVLRTHGLPRPERLAGIASFDQLRDTMRNARWSQVFVKPCHASTASGVIALRCSDRGTIAITSLEQVSRPTEWHFYNSFKVRRYDREADVARAVDFILGEGAVVERWIPKLTVGDSAVDVRVVVIDGHPLHTVARASRRPITNLHLRSRRLAGDDIRRRIGDSAWEAGLHSAAAASRACGCGYSGIDLLFDPTGRHAILEVNAFGDLLPGLLHRGRDTYTSEIEMLGRVA